MISDSDLFPSIPGDFRCHVACALFAYDPPCKQIWHYVVQWINLACSSDTQFIRLAVAFCAWFLPPDGARSCGELEAGRSGISFVKNVQFDQP